MRKHILFYRGQHVKCHVIHKFSNFLFRDSDDSATLNKIKLNIYLLQENPIDAAGANKGTV